ncbi:hypothetical protein IU449_12230 [Nocardia higoensis]|uniref:Uncharacterized protein n=1 Tax=Nocardia higoensis TaxID=228599 RepID=A0ABS0DA71_9NOCA|nr:hypothetical protein [Nocardia higoensis]MBF6355301.1 hypothetical protein [Nocardia higoensis]
MFLLDNNDDRNRIEWGGATVVFGLLLLAAIGLAVLVNTADFGTGETDNPTTRTSTPQPSPGPCEPFCLKPRTQ